MLRPAAYALACALGVLVLVLCGCSASTVPLSYLPTGPAAYPAPGAAMVTLTVLEDQRPNPSNVGVARDGAPIKASANVADWVSRALADELTRQGLMVSYAQNPSVAVASGAPVVSGTIDELWLQENGILSYSLRMAITLRITDKQGNLLSTESFRASQSATLLPGENALREMMTDSLRDLVAPAGRKVRQLL